MSTTTENPTLTEIADEIVGRMASHPDEQGQISVSYSFLVDTVSQLRRAEGALNAERGLSLQFIPEVIRDHVDSAGWPDENLDGIDDQTLRMAAGDVLDTGCLDDVTVTALDEIVDRARYLHREGL